ncbi:hypothetical protein LEMLEM_LOCUS5947, partial [Lemmus lemmus]
MGLYTGSEGVFCARYTRQAVIGAKLLLGRSGGSPGERVSCLSE